MFLYFKWRFYSQRICYSRAGISGKTSDASELLGSVITHATCDPRRNHSKLCSKWMLVLKPEKMCKHSFTKLFEQNTFFSRLYLPVWSKLSNFLRSAWPAQLSSSLFAFLSFLYIKAEAEVTGNTFSALVHKTTWHIPALLGDSLTSDRGLVLAWPPPLRGRNIIEMSTWMVWMLRRHTSCRFTVRVVCGGLLQLAVIYRGTNAAAYSLFVIWSGVFFQVETHLFYKPPAAFPCLSGTFCVCSFLSPRLYCLFKRISKYKKEAVSCLWTEHVSPRR